MLKLVVRRIGQALSHFPAKTYFFEINIRAYSGWHKGYQPTPRRRELTGIPEEELYSLGDYSNMPIRKLMFGDLASGALDTRISKGTNSHYPATYRERGDKRFEEKMVDTALVSDLIYHAAQNDNSWLLVIGEDIDLVPGIYTAEGLMANTGRKISYLWSKQEQLLNCVGLERFYVDGEA